MENRKSADQLPAPVPVGPAARVAKRAGYTWKELLVTIVVIGVLLATAAAVVEPQPRGSPGGWPA